MKRTLVGLVCVTAIALSVWAIWKRSQPKNIGLRKPNILVISTCSLRADAVEFMPKVQEFFNQGAYTFNNAFNGLGWTAIFAVTAPEIRNRWFDKVAYHRAGHLIKEQMYLVPPRNSWKEGFSRGQKRVGEAPPDSNFEKNYRESLNYLIDFLAVDGMLPYFLVAQLKYTHYPLIDKYNADSRWDQFLSEDEKARVNRYRENPKHYPAKLPFLLMLTNEANLLHAHPLVNQAMAQKSRDGAGHDSAFLGLLNTPQFLEDWKKSPDYEADLEILKKIYKANVLYLDKIIGEVFARLKAKGGLENTVVIFVGDHGEVHMERGHLTHGTSWFDPALKVPLMIRFPDQSENVKIPAQTNFFTVTKIIKGIAEGVITAENLSEKFKALNDPVLIGRDCSNTWRAIRSDNKWKYAVDNSSGENWLYDLEVDPGETKNIASERPEVIAELETLYWQKLPRLSNQMVNTCEPWPGPKPVREEN